MAAGMSAVEFFDGFAWAVPTVFAGSLGECLFHKGDMFHDSRRGYERWEEALKHLQFSLTVKSLGIGIGSGTFRDNWNCEVVVEIADHRRRHYRERITTQGRLYTLLWKGDLEVLENTDSPPVPLTLMDLPALSEAAVSCIRARIGIGMKHPNIWLMPLDRTNEVASAKYEATKAVLTRGFNIVEKTFTLEDLGMNLFVVPTMRYAGFAVDQSETVKVANALKEALYFPSRNRKSVEDKFRLEAHGYLLSAEAERRALDSTGLQAAPLSYQ